MSVAQTSTRTVHGRWPFRVLHARAEKRGLHGKDHINRQRKIALTLVITAMIRAGAWSTLIVLYLLHVPFTTDLFKSVAFVALISLYANAATDFGQGCASLAQLSAEDAHHDVEGARATLQVNTVELERDLAELARMQPCEEGEQLARRIFERIRMAV